MHTVAIIGCGRIAVYAHLPVLSEMEDVRIKYACDILPEKAEALKAKFPKIEQTITDYRVALADPEVTAVFVLTPNALHHPITMDALRAGKHVMCEKPISVSYELAREMKEEAERRGLILNIGVCNRHGLAVKAIHDAIAEGRLGKVYHVYCSFRAHRNIPGLGGAFTTKALSGGGVLIDTGVHFFDLILYILGGARLRTATCNTYSEMAKDMSAYRYKYMWAEDTKDLNGTNDVDDCVTGFIRTDSASISFNGAWAHNIGATEMFVDFFGDRGGARFDYGKKTVTFFDGETLGEETPELPAYNTYAAEDRTFLDSTVGGPLDRNHIDNVLETARVLDALYASAAAGREISFE